MPSRRARSTSSAFSFAALGEAHERERGAGPGFSLGGPAHERADQDVLLRRQMAKCPRHLERPPR